MNLNAKSIITMVIVAGILSIGLISYSQIQQTSAQSTGLPGLGNIPGYNLFEEMVGSSGSK